MNEMNERAGTLSFSFSCQMDGDKENLSEASVQALALFFAHLYRRIGYLQSFSLLAS